MKLQRIFFTLLLIFILCTKGTSQCEPLVPPTSSCETAPSICFNQACFTTSDTSLDCCNNWCGFNTIINNPQFFQFKPTQPDITIEIHVDDCTNGVGLQSGIINACPWDNSNILTCNPGANPGGSMVLSADGLIPGEPYWLFIDGSNGALCHYTITSVAGIYGPPLMDTLDAALTYASEEVICPGYWELILTTGPEIPGAHYEWTFGWNGEVLVSDSISTPAFVGYDSPVGIWEICVRAFTGCDTLAPICFPIEIANKPGIIKDSATLCQSEFPFQWHDQHISGPGTYTATFYDEHFCRIDSTWNIGEYPLSAHGRVDTFVCQPYFVFEGQTFDSSDHYEVLLPGSNKNGCDSIVDLYLTLGASDQFIELVCENDQPSLHVHIIAQDASIDTVRFEWYDCTFDSILSTATAFLPASAGCYGLITRSGVCTDTVSSEYLISPCEINILCGLANSSGCEDDTVWLTPAFPVPDGAQIHWLLGLDEPEIYIGNRDSIWAISPYPGTFQLSYTIQDSTQTWTCQSQLEIKTGPTVGLCCDISTCDTCAVYTLHNYSPDPAFIFLNDGTIPPVTFQGETSQMICYPSMPADSLIVAITDVVSATNGCQGHISGDSSISITQVPDPLVFIVDFTDSLCSYPNDLAFYRWRQCDSTAILSTSTCFVPPASGCYCLEVENEIGCSYETCTDFIVNEPFIIQDGQIIITPNPSKGEITIELPSVLTPVEWQLDDVQGQFITKGKLITSKSDLRLNSVSAGIYFLKLDLGKNGIVVKKIVIE